MISSRIPIEGQAKIPATLASAQPRKRRDLGRVAPSGERRGGPAIEMPDPDCDGVVGDPKWRRTSGRGRSLGSPLQRDRQTRWWTDGD
jgi:hypothetical protein